MPLRALLLLPEQPSTSSLSENNGALKLSVSTPAPSPRSSHARPDGYDDSTSQAEANVDANFKVQRGTSWSNIRKRLPSAGPDRERDPDQRASNQTYKTNLTLPTTSGTDHAPSPPLSPASSAMSARASLRQNTALLETDSRGRPKLKVETKIPKVGSMVRYKHESNGRHRPGSLIESPVNVDIGVGTSRMDSEGLSSGEKTARDAVDARLQHLLATEPESIPPVPPLPPLPLVPNTSSATRARISRSRSNDRISRQSSTSRLSSGSNVANVPSESKPRTPVRKPSAVPPPSPVGLPVPVASLLPSPTVPIVPIPPITSTAKRKTIPSQARKHSHLHIQPTRRPLSNNPPSPPTRGIPPYRIMSQADFLRMQVTTDEKKVQLGWCKRHSFQIQRVPKPKGTKGKYIRLVTLPVPEGENIDENNNDDLNLVTVKRGKVLPKIQVNSNDRDEDDDDGDENDKARKQFVPTVFMTEIVASQFNKPVACMMWPPPPVSSLNSGTSRAARRLTRRLSTQSTTSTSPSRPENQDQIQTLPPLSYQFPLVSLTLVQRAALISAGLLVYAVPRGYQGPVPPPELDIVDNEENKVIAPWNRDALLSPRASMESNPSSPRWAVESVWSSVAGGSKGKDKAKGLTVNTGAAATDSRRTSVSSVKSVTTEGVSDIPPVPPIPAIFAGSNPVSGSVEINRSASAPNTSGGLSSGWTSSFSSLRAKAQGYYAANSTSSSSDPNGRPKSQHSAQESQASIPPVNVSNSGAPGVSGGAINTSRSLGSFFSRVSAAATTTKTPSRSPGERIPDSGYSSSVGGDADAAGEGDKDRSKPRTSSSGEVLFDGEREVDKQPQTAPPTTTTTATATATATATTATQAKSWRGWAGRWGS